jgi:Ser/Thr protein kinase RdoA (MazF antagonist)
MYNSKPTSMTGSGETKFFYELSPDRILTAVESLGFRCTGRCLALNSMENRVYEVEIDSDDDSLARAHPSRFKIAKFYRPGRWTKEQILEEHQFLFDLGDSDVPVVAPIRSPTGASLHEVESTGIWFAIFDKIGGRSPDEFTSEQLPQIGRLLARLHNIGATRVAAHRLSTSVETLGMGALKSVQISGLIPNELAGRYSELVNQICEMARPLLSKATAQRIHGDCHLGNLLWGAEGPFWVDFDDMMVGPPVQDIWLLLPGRDEHALSQLRILLDGYQQMREFDFESLELIEPLRALRMIHFAGWIAKRWEDPAFKRAFTDFGTLGYWNELLQNLAEQLYFMENEKHFWLK